MDFTLTCFYSTRVILSATNLRLLYPMYSRKINLNPAERNNEKNTIIFCFSAFIDWYELKGGPIIRVHKSYFISNAKDSSLRIYFGLTFSVISSDKKIHFEVFEEKS